MPPERQTRALPGAARLALVSTDGVLAGRSAAKSRDLAPLLKATMLVAFFYVTGAAYLKAAFDAASRTPFWTDEVLAVWVARLPSVHEITQAIWHGAEFSPPTYDLLLHLVFQSFGSSPLVARMPSILAVLATACVVAWIIGRRLGALSSALAFGICLSSPLFAFAVQARPYAILIALTSVILLLWSDHKRGVWRPVVIGLLLLACMSLHVYAIVTFAVFALMEALASMRSRVVRPAIWLALAVASAASAVWLPLVRHLSAFNSGDTGAPEFYGAPTLRHLVDHFDTLFHGSLAFGLFLSVALFLVAGAFAWSSVRQSPSRPSNVRTGDEADIAIMAAALLASLPLGFVLALGVTHVFSARYALAATLGAILLLVLGLSRVPYPRVVGVMLCAVLVLLPLLRGLPSSDAARAIAQLGDAGAPIVVSDSNLFIEMMESAPPALRDRLVHLTKPPGVVDPDTSADHQLQRLVTSFRPNLRVLDPIAFVAAHETFTEVCRPSRSTDALCAWLVAQGAVRGAIALDASVAVLNIGAGSHAEHP